MVLAWVALMVCILTYTVNWVVHYKESPQWDNEEYRAIMTKVRYQKLNIQSATCIHASVHIVAASWSCMAPTCQRPYARLLSTFLCWPLHTPTGPMGSVLCTSANTWVITHSACRPFKAISLVLAATHIKCPTCR